MISLAASPQTRAMDVATYLARLPAGLDSYPEATAKVALARAFAERLRRDFPGFRLDPVLLGPLDRPVSGWIPETYNTATFLAARSAFDDDETFLSWVADADRELLSGPLYRMLFWLVGPKRVLRSGAERWGRFHRGSTLAIEPVGEREVIARLGYPRELFPPLVNRAFARSFRVALELAGAASCSCEVTEQTPTEASFLARWS